ncbi:MAG: undecaprenyl-diphosphate phosphatase [Candidatus Thermoplasmatota archaeon]|nr:undecaprenyl-diphosphate phosphatase [Candidatus Thermoplasmatota archaeon]
MDPIEALVLGVIQGLTEWLPVSSSGHLVIAQEMLGLPAGENLVFDLVVHLGTIVAVCLFFRKELGRIILSMFMGKARRGDAENALRKLGFLLLLGTVPAAVVGVLLTEQVEDVFDLRLVGAALMANAALLLISERYGAGGSRKNASAIDALVIGMFQALAILPGISRSGSTIGGGMLRGLERETAAVFAFLLSVPTLLGAFAYGMLTLDRFELALGESAIGCAAAFITGLASISYLLKAVRQKRLWVFAAYCLVLGIAVLAWTL